MPPCGTVVGEALAFGVGDSDEFSLITSSIKNVRKADKKEARDSCGNVAAVAYYNKSNEVEVVVLGEYSAADVGGSVSLANTLTPTPVGTLYIDEISVDYSNEDFPKTTVKLTAYDGIPGA